MKKKRLGRAGPEISVVGFGTWAAGGMGWGENPPDEQTVKAMQVAIDSGVDWIDTAEVYGAGHSEELVGRAVEGRDDTMIFHLGMYRGHYMTEWARGVLGDLGVVDPETSTPDLRTARIYAGHALRAGDGKDAQGSGRQLRRVFAKTADARRHLAAEDRRHRLAAARFGR